ncbi:MAG: hypothetical protein AAGI88_17775 [Pseudomonadota bacterium]
MTTLLNSGSAPKGSQTGVALALVVWFIAGMSILVAGVVAAVRTDTRFATLHRERAQISTAGDGAINLFLAELLSVRGASVNSQGGAGPTNLSPRNYRIGPTLFRVLAVPAALHINPQNAQPQELAQLFVASGAVPTDQVQAVTGAVVQWRADPRAGVRRSGSRMSALEDLLEVPGVNRVILDGIADFAYVPAVTGRRARPQIRTSEMLALLRLAAPGTRAAQGEPQIELPAGLAARVSLFRGELRVDAMANIDGRYWLRRKWVSFQGSQAGLPWRVEQAEPARVISTGARF